MVRAMSTAQTEVIVSNLNSQISTLRVLADTVGSRDDADVCFVAESLKQTEKGIRELRKFYQTY